MMVTQLEEVQAKAYSSYVEAQDFECC